MTYYDYKVVPAPRRARKVKGIAAGPDLFALTLTDAINEVARQAIRARKSDEQFAEFTRQVRDKAYVEYKIDER